MLDSYALMMKSRNTNNKIKSQHLCNSSCAQKGLSRQEFEGIVNEAQCLAYKEKVKKQKEG